MPLRIWPITLFVKSANYAKRLRKAAGKRSQRSDKSPVRATNNAAAKELLSTSLAQRVKAAKAFFGKAAPLEVVAASTINTRLLSKLRRQERRRKQDTSTTSKLNTTAKPRKRLADDKTVVRKSNQEAGGGGELKQAKLFAAANTDESTQRRIKKIQTIPSSMYGELEEDKNASTLNATRDKGSKKEQERVFQNAAQNLRCGLIKIFDEAGACLPGPYSNQILLFLIIDGLKPDTADANAYQHVLQNLVEKLPTLEKIKSFLEEKEGKAYWQSLQKLKSLYLLEDEMSLEEIKENLCKHAQINLSETRPDPEEVLKAAQV